MAYQGHKNWEHWNVALWIGNDEGLYRAALRAIRGTANRADAADALLEQLPTLTPDGATYNKTNVRAALRWLE
jgi:hypothetical protein